MPEEVGMKQQQKTNYTETSLNEPRGIVYNSVFAIIPKNESHLSLSVLHLDLARKQV